MMTKRDVKCVVCGDELKFSNCYQVAVKDGCERGWWWESVCTADRNSEFEGRYHPRLQRRLRI